MLAKKTEGKEGLNLQQLEEVLVRDQFIIDHENYRKDNWEPLKHFRSKYDAEYPVSQTILSANEIANRRKDMDKNTLNAIRLCILNDEHERVFSYMELLHFSQSLKLCVNLCEQLNASDLSQKIAKFITEKEQKDLMLESYKNSNRPQGNVNALENRRMMKAAITSQEKPDLSQFAINSSGPATSLLAKATSSENEASRDLQEIPEAKSTA